MCDSCCYSNVTQTEKQRLRHKHREIPAVKQNVLSSAPAAATFYAESQNARYVLTFSGIYSLGLFADEPEQNQAFNLQPDHS